MYERNTYFKISGCIRKIICPIRLPVPLITRSYNNSDRWKSVNDSNQCCSICGLTPSKIFQLLYLKVDLITDYPFCTSGYIAWNAFLHISYRLEFKTWQARGLKKKEMVKRKKQYVQDALRKKLDIVIDVPKSGGKI